MNILRNTALGVAGAATLLVSAMPLTAADISAPVSVSGHGKIMVEQTADGHRRRWRRHDHIDGGDVLAGIGILAGIAIIAGAASDAEGSSRRRDDGPVYRDNAPERYDDTPSRSSGNDLGSAVSACTEAAERSAGGGVRVEEIRSVTRDGQGWRVDGELDRGSKRGFTCNATDGRVDNIQLDDAGI